MKAQVEVLYHEVAGAGTDNEHSQYADGIEVTLEKWTANSSFPRRDHYILITAVMVDREIEAETYTAEAFYVSHDATQIRNAIQRFDELLEAHPSRDVLRTSRR